MKEFRAILLEGNSFDRPTIMFVFEGGQFTCDKTKPLNMSLEQMFCMDSYKKAFNETST